MDPLVTGKRVIRLERLALEQLENHLDDSFVKAVHLIHQNQGRLVITGMGKAGQIAKKIASTFSSLGTPAFFLHPGEAAHGDLGMLSSKDILLALSNSGESAEIISLLPYVKTLGVRVIALCARLDCTLAGEATITLTLGAVEEACLFGLAPTSSTTAMLALGDALAVSVMELRPEFKQDDFAFFHPAGALGKKLAKVSQVMKRAEDAVILDQNVSVKETLFSITKHKAGAALLVDKTGKLCGIFSDGDLRRHLEKGTDFLDQPVSLFMTQNPKSISANRFAMEALKLLRDFRIGELPVVDENGLAVGVISLKDLVTVGLL